MVTLLKKECDGPAARAVSSGRSSSIYPAEIQRCVQTIDAIVTSWMEGATELQCRESVEARMDASGLGRNKG